MARGNFAYLLMLFMAGATLGMWTLSQRYSRYRRALLHGRRRAKPSWKPFWMK